MSGEPCGPNIASSGSDYESTMRNRYSRRVAKRLQYQVAAEEERALGADGAGAPAAAVLGWSGLSTLLMSVLVGIFALFIVAIQAPDALAATLLEPIGAERTAEPGPTEIP